MPSVCSNHSLFRAQALSRLSVCMFSSHLTHFGMAAIAQLGERQTEDLKVPGSIPGLGIQFVIVFDVGFVGWGIF